MSHLRQLSLPTFNLNLQGHYITKLNFGTWCIHCLGYQLNNNIQNKNSGKFLNNKFHPIISMTLFNLIKRNKTILY